MTAIGHIQNFIIEGIVQNKFSEVLFQIQYRNNIVSKLIILPSHYLKIWRKSWEKTRGENGTTVKACFEKVKDGLQGMWKIPKGIKCFPTIGYVHICLFISFSSCLLSHQTKSS